MEQNPLPESLETRLIRCISPLIPVPSNLPMAHKAVILRQSSTDQELKAKREKKKKATKPLQFNTTTHQPKDEGW